MSEVFGGRVIETGPSGGVGVGKVLGWPQRGSSQVRAVLSSAKPGQPLDPELRSLLEASKRTCRRNRCPLKSAPYASGLREHRPWNPLDTDRTEPGPSLESCTSMPARPWACADTPEPGQAAAPLAAPLFPAAGP